MTRRAPHSVLVGALALLAACAPSTFDGLTGAQKDGAISPRTAEFNPADKSLDDKLPRPVGPFSTSWVNTARPRFRWELKPGTTGVELELSRTRDFKEVAKRVTATGSDHVMTEDLEPGTWFWRLQPRSATGKGTAYGPVWQVLVRGPSPRGSSEAARGGVVDIDGDGHAEILVSLVGLWAQDGSGAKTEVSDLLELYARESSPGVITYDLVRSYPVALEDPKATVGAGVDINGDGLGDYVLAQVSTPPVGQPGEAGAFLATIYGSLPWTGDAPPEEAGEDGEEDDKGLVPELRLPFTTQPTLAVGDFNGDGFGDVGGFFPDLGVTFLGATAGLTTMSPFTGGRPSTPPLAFTAVASDFDGDGLSDLVFSPYDASSPLQVSLGKKTRPTFPTNVVPGGSFALPGRAIATAAGDFDGDAIEEIAFTALLPDGRAAVCVHSTAKPSLNEHGCWIGEAAAAGFGTTLKALDLDGDGRDELIVGSAGALFALTHAGDNYDTPESVFTATPIAGAYSASLTVLHPGRPGKARWAVLGADQRSLFIHEGLGDGSLKQTLDLKTLSTGQFDFVRTSGTIR